MNKLNNLSQKDSVIKVVSVLIAILIWFLVLDQDNPFEERTLAVLLSSNIEVLDSNNLQIVGTQIPTSIDVKIKGRRNKIMGVTANDFKAVIDLSSVTDSGTRRIDISIPQYIGDQDIVISSINPTSVNLNFEKIVGKQYPVNVVYTGALPTGYELVNLKVEPNNVILEEKESSILKVSKVVAQINLNDIKDNKEIIMRGTVLDAAGQPLKQFDGKVPIIVTFDLAKHVPVVATIKGTPEEGHYVKEIRYSLPAIRVLGSRSVLDSLTKINSEPIDITGKTDDFKSPLVLILPKGVTAMKEDTDQLTAEMVLEKFSTRSIDVPSSFISIFESDTSGANEYRIAGESVTLTINGKLEDINNIRTSDISLSVNVSGLGQGEHVVPLSVNLPDNITLVGEYSVKVIIGATPKDQTTSNILD